MNSGQQSCRAKGPRASGGRVVHVVSVSTTVSQLQSLMADKLGPKFSGEEFEVQVWQTNKMVFLNVSSIAYCILIKFKFAQFSISNGLFNEMTRDETQWLCSLTMSHLCKGLMRLDLPRRLGCLFI